MKPKDAELTEKMNKIMKPLEGLFTDTIPMKLAEALFNAYTIGEQDGIKLGEKKTLAEVEKLDKIGIKKGLGIMITMGEWQALKKMLKERK